MSIRKIIKNNYYLLLTETKVSYFIMPTQGALKSSALSNLISIQETSLHLNVSVTKSNSYFWQATN